MKTVRKTLILAACAIMLVCATIAGTLAYLTAQVSVKNTFTVGNVAITMDETDVDNSTPGGNDRDTENEYKLLPGQTYTKDPIIHVSATSEDCYVFVKVTNNISSVEATGNNTIAKQLEANGWKAVPPMKAMSTTWKMLLMPARTSRCSVDSLSATAPQMSS